MSDAPKGASVLSARSAAAIAARPFVLHWRGASAELEGARWWNESQRAWQVARRASDGASPGSRLGRRVWILSIGGVVAAVLIPRLFHSLADSGDPVVSMKALEVQQQMGWNAGEIATRLSFGTTLLLRDVDEGPLLTEHMITLWSALRPVQPTWAPYYVPTLFRSLAEDRAGDLRAQMQIVHTDSMDEAFRRGQGIVDLFRDAGAPHDVALVVDLPGPEAVALAAALSSWFEPIWLFDNWPHPLGVVASHRVLGAVLYYLPLLQRSAGGLEPPASSPDAGTSREGGPRRSAGAGRPTGAPPVFVLDSNRLAPYTDAADQFDNRYLARLPSAAALRDAGYRRVLYVRPSGSTVSQLQELDDLNDDFLAYRDHEIDVRAVATDDFRLDALGAASSGAPRYAWGGSSHTHVIFWHTYGWSTRGVAAGAAPTRPSGIAAGADYRPVARPTLFSSRTVGGLGGVGKQRPSGFGVVSVRQSPSGRITAMGSGRSGSFGRYGGSSFG